jgi:vancomycin resistance protein VanJ
LANNLKSPAHAFAPALKIASAVLDFCALGLILFLILMLIPRRPWFVEMLSSFLSWALLPSLFVLIVMTAMRRWRSAALWIVPTIAFFVLFGELFLPGLRSKPIDDFDEIASGRHLRVMTWNLKGNTLSDPQPQIDILRDSGADIIALQEVSHDSAPAIEAQLADLYPYRVLFPMGVAGTGLLSKYPIESREVFQLTPGALYHCKVVLDVDGEPITVISAHPAPPLSLSQFRYYSLRRSEIGALVQMASQGGPVLLMGDFNITDQSSLYPLLTDSGLHDTFREAGWGFGPTWPARLQPIGRFCPLLRMDFIWHTDDFQALSVRIGRRAVSDHLAVIADLVYVP